MPTTVVELFKNRGKWRWRMRDYRNRKIIGASTEGYANRYDAVKNLQRVSNVGVAGYPALARPYDETEAKAKVDT
jgi:uncharacterized protein YegP (UPF0339 family)